MVLYLVVIQYIGILCFKAGTKNLAKTLNKVLFLFSFSLLLSLYCENKITASSFLFFSLSFEKESREKKKRSKRKKERKKTLIGLVHSSKV